MTTKEKNPPLYCGDFSPELKERCEAIAGALRITMTDFVAGILDDETKDLQVSVDAIARWYKGRLETREHKTPVLNSAHESGKEEVRRDPGQADKDRTAKTLRSKAGRKKEET